MLRLHVIDAVFKRNFLSYFSGVIGYIFISAFVLLASMRAFNSQFFANNLATLDQFNVAFPGLLLFLVPAITMSVWSDERKQGTDELLFTLPATDVEILLGKYAAVVGIYTVALIFSLSNVFVLLYLGSPDLGTIFSNYLGFWISGCALLGAGMLASSLTSNATVAYIVAGVFCGIPVLLEMIPSDSRVVQGLSAGEQLRDFNLGMIPLAGVVYYLSFGALMLYLNLVVISRRHWSGGPHRAPMGTHYLIRSIALVAILVSVTAIAMGKNYRKDLTRDKAYSLSETTLKALKSVSTERPVLVQAFISPEVPRDLVPVRTSLVGLLRQFEQYGGDRVRVRIKPTERYTDAAEEAKRYGIDAVEVQSEPNGRTVRDDVYLGVVVTSVEQQVVIPFFDKGTPVEYELTRSIRTVSQTSRKTIGVLTTDLQVNGGFDMQNFRQLPEWRIVREMKKQYEVRTVSPDELTTTNVDTLLAVMPSSLTDPQMQSLVDYINQGKPTLIIDDPFPLFVPSVAPRIPKPRPGGPMGMMGGGAPPQPKADNGRATKLSNALGIDWDSGATVWDEKFDPHSEFREFLDAVGILDVVYVTPASQAKFALNPESRITQSLQEVMFFYPGAIWQKKESKLDFKPLLRSSPNSVTYEWEEYTQNMGGMFGGGGVIPIHPESKSPKKEQISPTIAARITGSDADPSKKINVVFVADVDAFADAAFYIRDKEWQDLKLDNIPFILNAMDELMGEDALLSLRSRQVRRSTLTTIEKSTLEYKKDQKKEADEADAEAKKALETKESELQAEIDKIDQDKSLTAQAKRQQVELARRKKEQELVVEKANIENQKKRALKKAKDTAERKIRKVEGNTRLIAILLPPIPPLILGLFFFAKRIKDERQGIVADRLVSRKSH